MVYVTERHIHWCTGGGGGEELPWVPEPQGKGKYDRKANRAYDVQNISFIVTTSLGGKKNIIS